MSKALAVARLGVREILVHRKYLTAYLIFLVLALVQGFFLYRSLEDGLVPEDVSTNGWILAANTTIISVLCSVVLGGSLLSHELRRGTLEATLTKPLSRWSYLLGRYLAVAGFLAGFWILVAGWSFLVRGTLGVVLFEGRTLWGGFLTACVLAAIAGLLSNFMGTAPAAVLAVLFQTLPGYLAHLELLDRHGPLLRSVFWISPRWGLLGNRALDEAPLLAAWAGLHATVYVAMCLVVAWLLFLARDLRHDPSSG